MRFGGKLSVTKSSHPMPDIPTVHELSAKASVVHVTPSVLFVDTFQREAVAPVTSAGLVGTRATP